MLELVVEAGDSAARRGLSLLKPCSAPPPPPASSSSSPDLRGDVSDRFETSRLPLLMFSAPAPPGLSIAPAPAEG
eukprot:751149-Hanusia_phi.AAC.2